MSNQDQIKKLNRECKLRLAPSKVHGIGVVALYDIPKGTRLFADNMPQVYTLPYGNFGKLHVPVKDILLERWPQIVNGSAFIYPDARMLAYMNHADEPSYDSKNDITLRDIKAGEEITEDYRTINGWEKVFTWLRPLDKIKCDTLEHMLHTCIKPTCGKQYRDNDEEAYYCPDCQKEKVAVAAKIDAQFVGKSRAPVVSELQAFENDAKVFTDPNTGRKIYFARA